MVCPLMSYQGEDKTDCLKEDCAWWVLYSSSAVSGKGRCAIVKIANKNA